MSKPPTLIYSHRYEGQRDLLMLEPGSIVFKHIETGEFAKVLRGTIVLLSRMIYGGRQFRLRFEHIIPPPQVIEQDKKAKVITVAQVQIAEGDPSFWATIFEGECRQRPSNFKRAVGRKVALTRALLHDRSIMRNKDFRRAVWYLYWHTLGLDLNDKDYQP